MPLFDDVVTREVQEDVLDRDQVDAVEQHADLAAETVDAAEAARRQDSLRPVGSGLLRGDEELGGGLQAGDGGVQRVGDRVEQIVGRRRQRLEVSARVGRERAHPQLIDAGGALHDVGRQHEQLPLLVRAEVRELAVIGRRTRGPQGGHLRDEVVAGPLQIDWLAEFGSEEEHRHVVSSVRVQVGVRFGRCGADARCG